MNQRNRLTLLISALLALTLVATGCGSDDDTAATTQTDDTGSSNGADVGSTESDPLSAVDVGDVTVHAFYGTTGDNGTYAIESANSIVVVDSQFQDPDPANFRAAVDTLGKPIEAMLITHDHPDHIGGLDTAFAGIPIFTTAGVAANIAGDGRNIEVVDGTFDIDGVTYTATEYPDAEAEQQMVITLDSGNALFAGDLVYEGTHSFLRPAIAEWIAILEEFKAGPAAVVFPGHGRPGGPELFDQNIGYLETAAELLASSADGDEYTAAIKDAYPDYVGDALIGFYADSLVGQQLLQPDES